MKKQICRLLTAALAAVFLLSLTACGENPDHPDETADPAKTAQTSQAASGTTAEGGTETKQPEETLPPKFDGEHEDARFPGETDSAADGSFGSGSFSYADDGNWSHTYGAKET